MISRKIQTLIVSVDQIDSYIQMFAEDIIVLHIGGNKWCNHFMRILTILPNPTASYKILIVVKRVEIKYDKLNMTKY